MGLTPFVNNELNKGTDWAHYFGGINIVGFDTTVPIFLLKITVVKYVLILI